MGSARGPLARVEPYRLAGRRSNAWLARASVAALPSSWPEPFGLVGLEAAALGVPTVAFDVGGISEWLRHDVNGVAVPGPPSAEPLGEALRGFSATSAGLPRCARARGGSPERCRSAHAWIVCRMFPRVSTRSWRCPQMLVGLSLHKGDEDAVRRQSAACVALAGFDGIEAVNVQFTPGASRSNTRMPTLRALNTDSAQVTGSSGRRKPIASEMFDVLPSEAAAPATVTSRTSMPTSW